MSITIKKINDVKNIDKPWGYEKWIAEGSPNFKYALKEILFKSKFKSSIRDNSIYIYLDVVGKQTLSSLFMPKLRIAGGIKPYSKAADICTQSIYNTEPPPRVLLSSRVICRGLTTPKEGASDSSVLSILFESNAKTYGDSIVSENWDQNVNLDTDLYSDNFT